MKVAGLVLAAGRASRYRAAGGTAESKLVDAFRGVPLVCYPVRAALASELASVTVVTGHARAAVEQALDGLRVRFVHNADYATGLASSLRAGLAALDPEHDAAIVLLGDMPLVGPSLIRLLVQATAPGVDAVVPLVEGERGNPVLLGRSLFDRAKTLSGDEGARRLLRDPSLRVAEVAVEGVAARLDIDEPGGLSA